MCLKSNQDFIKNDWTRKPRQFGNGLQYKDSATGTIRWNICVLGYFTSIVGCVFLLMFKRPSGFTAGWAKTLRLSSSTLSSPTHSKLYRRSFTAISMLYAQAYL
ncbi:hypothetical protein CGMCC3_g12341 [Colletotrichum fructicola]|nr:uncharacterized protein CGMCC3_g12341 [Colletotrichum fructicola]KAE9571563.1 hypothetical protein CGMCC3_g12341 [Colletotrichum fructicola]